MSIENGQFELFSPDPVGGSSSGRGEGQKPADFGQAAGAPDWGVPGEERRAVWEATGYVPPIAGGAPNKPEKPKHRKGEPVDLSNQPESVDCYSRFLDLKGIDVDKDLSPDAQWLFGELSPGVVSKKTLTRWAEMDGIDLNAALEELNQHGFIDTSDPDYYDLAYQKITPRW